MTATSTDGVAQTALAMIRTRSDLHRWAAANAHGRQMHNAVALLRQAATEDPTGLLPIVGKAISAAVRVILRADDSSGIIGDAIRDLLELHADLARRDPPPAPKLTKWLIGFQFDGSQDFFNIDISQYAAALGDKGLALYRANLAEIETGLGPEATQQQERDYFEARFNDPDGWRQLAHNRHTRFLLGHNAQRLAVADRDPTAIIATHSRDGKAVWLHETAKALAEIGAFDLAIDYARQAADAYGDVQARNAAIYWCDLLAAHRPAEEIAARLEVFSRWPSASTAEHLRQATGPAWPDHRDHVLNVLGRWPREAVIFAQHHLRDADLAWTLAHNLNLTDDRTWSDLADVYEKIDPVAILPVLRRLAIASLHGDADARAYRHAARLLRRMRHIAADTDSPGADGPGTDSPGRDSAVDVDALISTLREQHRRRPRLQREFDAAKLP